MPLLPDALASFSAALNGIDQGLAEHIVDTAGISGQDRLNIYQRSVQGIQTDALTSIFPTIDKLTGNQFFRAMCQAYVKACPSPSGDLHQLGSHMAEFLESFEPVAGLPYLVDTARLEWLWHQVFHKQDCEETNLPQLADIPASDHSNLIFLMRPASALLQSEYPVYQIWESNQQPDDERIIDLDSGGENLVISRIERKMYIAATDLDIWAFLNDVNQGMTLEKLTESHAIDMLLPASVRNGWITHFKKI